MDMKTLRGEIGREEEATDRNIQVKESVVPSSFLQTTEQWFINTDWLYCLARFNIS